MRLWRRAQSSPQTVRPESVLAPGCMEGVEPGAAGAECTWLRREPGTSSSWEWLMVDRPRSCSGAAVRGAGLGWGLVCCCCFLLHPAPMLAGERSGSFPSDTHADVVLAVAAAELIHSLEVASPLHH